MAKVLQIKLAFSLEQNFSFTMLAYEIGCLQQTKDSNPIHFSLFKYCTKLMQTVLTDDDIQVLSPSVRATLI